MKTTRGVEGFSPVLPCQREKNKNRSSSFLSCLEKEIQRHGRTTARFQDTGSKGRVWGLGRIGEAMQSRKYHSDGKVHETGRDGLLRRPTYNRNIYFSFLLFFAPFPHFPPSPNLFLLTFLSTKLTFDARRSMRGTASYRQGQNKMIGQF